MSDESIEGVVGLFKALADPTRLRIVGLAVGRSRCGQELASILGLSPATVSHHLQVLRRAGLLRETRQTPYTFYEVDLAPIRGTMRQLADRKRVEAFGQDSGLPPEKRKVLRSFFDGSRLVQIPVAGRKKEIVLEEVLRRLPRRKEYEERQLSRWLEAIHEDYATLRREFVDRRYMERSAGRYWLTDRGRAALAEG